MSKYSIIGDMDDRDNNIQPPSAPTIDTIIDNYITDGKYRSKIGGLSHLREHIINNGLLQSSIPLVVSKMFVDTSGDLTYNVKMYVVTNDTRYMLNILCICFNKTTNKFDSLITSDF